MLKFLSFFLMSLIFSLSSFLFAEEEVLEVITPMPGMLVKFHVKEGDCVEIGQSLYVIEVMKMQVNMRAPRRGYIGKIEAEEGQIVQENFMLMHIFKNPLNDIPVIENIERPLEKMIEEEVVNIAENLPIDIPFVPHNNEIEKADVKNDLIPVNEEKNKPLMPNELFEEVIDQGKHLPSLINENNDVPQRRRQPIKRGVLTPIQDETNDFFPVEGEKEPEQEDLLLFFVGPVPPSQSDLIKHEKEFQKEDSQPASDVSKEAFIKIASEKLKSKEKIPVKNLYNLKMSDDEVVKKSPDFALKRALMLMNQFDQSLGDLYAVLYHFQSNHSPTRFFSSQLEEDVYGIEPMSKTFLFDNHASVGENNVSFLKIFTNWRVNKSKCVKDPILDFSHNERDEYVKTNEFPSVMSSRLKIIPTFLQNFEKKVVSISHRLIADIKKTFLLSFELSSESLFSLLAYNIVPESFYKHGLIASHFPIGLKEWKRFLENLLGAFCLVIFGYLGMQLITLGGAGKIRKANY